MTPTDPTVSMLKAQMNKNVRTIALVFLPGTDFKTASETVYNLHCFSGADVIAKFNDLDISIKKKR